MRLKPVKAVIAFITHIIINQLESRTAHRVIAHFGFPFDFVAVAILILHSRQNSISSKPTTP